jgi:hypothetical protein
MNSRGRCWPALIHGDRSERGTVDQFEHAPFQRMAFDADSRLSVLLV